MTSLSVFVDEITAELKFCFSFLASWQLSGSCLLGLLSYLIVHQGVQALPISFNLGGDVFILQDHTRYPALPPLCGRGRRDSQRRKRHYQAPSISGSGNHWAEEPAETPSCQETAPRESYVLLLNLTPARQVTATAFTQPSAALPLPRSGFCGLQLNRGAAPSQPSAPHPSASSKVHKLEEKLCSALLTESFALWSTDN